MSYLLSLYYWKPGVTRSEASCETQTYTGSVCQSELYEWQECFSEEAGSLADNNEKDVLIPSDVDQGTVEMNAKTLLELGLPLVTPSVECEAAIKSFLCLYLFGQCDTDHQLYQALQEDCVRVRDEICPREWGVATELLQDNPGLGSLPECEDLSNKTSNCFQQGNVTYDTEMISGSAPAIITTNCSDGFYLLNGSTCRPECGKWIHPNFVLDKVAEKWIIIASVVIALIATSLFMLIAATCQRKIIWVYPTTYLVYVIFATFMLALTILISASSEKKLFCHSRDLLETFENGTPFCTITGVVYYYCLIQIVMWLLFHSGALFWGIVFPFHYRQWKNEEKVKYVHIATVILALLFPTIAPIAALLKDGFISATTPTYACLGRNSHVSYATFVLPISVFAAMASSFLTIIFWTILKKTICSQETLRLKHECENQCH